MAGSFDADTDNRGKAGAQPILKTADGIWIEYDFHRDALDNLREIAGRVIRREQG